MRRLVALLVATVAVLGVTYVVSDQGTDDSTRGAEAEPTTTDVTPPSSTTSTVTATSTTTTTTIDSRALASTDRFSVAAGTSPVAGSGPLRTYSVEVEEGIPIESGVFAEAVDAILADPRGWTAGGGVSLRRVGPDGSPGFRVRLATPATVDAHCLPLRTVGELSCRQGADVMINLTRWLEGAAPSELPLEEYRQYLISHEVGHALGHHHEACPAPGAVAPVMLQQTKGLQGCAPNPWPFP
jgi:hypothetical protein